MKKLICLVPFLLSENVAAELNEPLWDKYGECYGAYALSGRAPGAGAYKESDDTKRVLNAVYAERENLETIGEAFVAGERYGRAIQQMGATYRAVYDNSGQSNAESFRMRTILDAGCERI